MSKGATIQYVEVPVAEVVPSPYQRRRNFPPEAAEEMAESVREHGVIEPVVVRVTASGRYELVAGERRWRAAQEVGLERVPALVRELTDREACAMCVVENLQRQDLTLLEEAESFEAMVEMGFEVNEVARKVGKGRVYVHRRRRLLELPEVARKRVDEGALTLHAAQELLKLVPEEREAALERLEERGLGQGLGERGALECLRAEFVEPAELTAAWEGVREMLDWPGVEVESWQAAQQAAHWSSGLEGAAEAPGHRYLSQIGREQAQKGLLESWGEIADRVGHGGRIAAEVMEEAEDGDRREDLEAVGWKVVGRFLVRRVVDPALVIEGEVARCAEEGLLCVFAAGATPEGGEEEKRRAAEEAAERRAAVRELEAEKREFLQDWLKKDNWTVSVRRELAQVAHREALYRWDLGWDVAECLGLCNRMEEDEEARADYEAEMGRRFEKGGELELLGRLLVAELFCETIENGGAVPAVFGRRGMFNEERFPRLAELGAAAADAEAAKGGTLQEEC